MTEHDAKPSHFLKIVIAKRITLERGYSFRYWLNSDNNYFSKNRNTHIAFQAN